jgi:tetratricopeptide (TPR) repeat protein
VKRKTTKRKSRKTKRKAHLLQHTFPIFAAIGATFLTAALLYLYQLPVESSAKTTDPFLLGEYYFNTQNDAQGVYDLERARAAYTEAQREDPAGNPLVWYQLGRIDFLQGRYVSALYKFNKQVEYFGDEIPNVYYMFGLTFAYKAQQSGDPAEWLYAEDSFKKYIEYDSESSWARVDLSWVYFSQGKYEEMIPVLEDALALHPDHPWLLNMYGLALLNTDSKEEAKEIFEKAQSEAAKLTTEDWGRAYPGNNPAQWQKGLESFRNAINQNASLAAQL